jgi:hypothetical protein
MTARTPLLAAALALSLAPAAGATEVDLELVLLADASGSIDAAEIALQRQGYAAAITDPAVIAALRSGPQGTIAVTYVEWAANQAVVVDWTILDGAESAEAFAAALLRPPRQAFGRNAIGAALLDGKTRIETNGIDGLRRVIDFSGDSTGNFSGPPIAAARAEVLAAGITINGLPILCRDCEEGFGNPRLAEAYEREIIGGPGAFVVPAEGRASFAEAVRRKLILEIAGTPPPAGVGRSMAGVAAIQGAGGGSAATVAR